MIMRSFGKTEIPLSLYLYYCILQNNSDISAYTYERTLMMEQRNQMLRALGLNLHALLCVPCRPIFTLIYGTISCVCGVQSAPNR